MISPYTVHHIHPINIPLQFKSSFPPVNHSHLPDAKRRSRGGGRDQGALAIAKTMAIFFLGENMGKLRI
jgi:hypothetical protein